MFVDRLLYLEVDVVAVYEVRSNKGRDGALTKDDE